MAGNDTSIQDADNEENKPGLDLSLGGDSNIKGLGGDSAKESPSGSAEIVRNKYNRVQDNYNTAQ